MFLDRRGGDRREPGINRNGWFSLTERGKERVSKFGYGNRPQDRLLVALECADASATLDDMARLSHMSKGQVERLLPGLISGGMVSDNAGYAGGAG